MFDFDLRPLIWAAFIGGIVVGALIFGAGGWLLHHLTLGWV